MNISMKILSKGLVLSLALSLGISSPSFGMSRLGAGLISGVKRGVTRRPMIAMAIAGTTTAAGLGATNIAWSKNTNAKNNALRSILIDKSKQNWRISEDCKDLTIPKGVDGCEVEIDAHVKGNVTIDGNNCTLKLLNGAEFGQKSTNSGIAINSFNGNVNSFNGHVSGRHTVVVGGVTIINSFNGNGSEGDIFINGTIRGRVIVNGKVVADSTTQADSVNDNSDSAGTTFYINGAHAHIVAAASKWLNKGLNGSVIVAGDHAHIDPSINGETTINGNNCRIGRSVHGELTITGHDCKIHSSVHGLTDIKGDHCHIDGSVYGQITVTGKKATIEGSVHGAAEIRKDTQIGGRAYGSKTVS